MEAGRKLATGGDPEGAIAFFGAARELDANLDLDAETEAQRIVVPYLARNLVEKGNMLVKKGEVKEAIATLAKAQKLDPMLEISAYSWNNLCWFGSLHGYAADVMYACENTVALDPENVGIRDSRGLARALSGDIEGAIADFQAFLDFWADNNEKRLQRQRWIEALRAGDRPFTPEEIETLLNQFYV